jgi:predicted transcriptional regulator
MTMEEYEDETRRGKLQMIRDVLLALELEGRPMKPTLLMYSIRLNWGAMKELVVQMNKKKLIKIVAPARTSRGRQLDRRTNVRISVTLKGKYVLRILDEMLRYLDDETPPQVNPPLWLMRKALQLKGFDFMGELKEMQNLNLLEAPSLLEDPTPLDLIVENPDESVIPLKPASAEEEGKGGVLFTLTEVNPTPPIRDYRPYEKAKGLAAGFTVRNAEVGLYCPECGHKAGNLRGLTVHIGSQHPDKKREIRVMLNRFHGFKLK